MPPVMLCVITYVSPIRDTGTAIREFKKRHNGSIERILEYQSIEVSDTQISDTGTAGLVKYR